MGMRRQSPAECVRTMRLIAKYKGNVLKTALAEGIPRSTLNQRVMWAKAMGITAETKLVEEQMQPPVTKIAKLPPSPSITRKQQKFSFTESGEPRRHFIIPDTQVRPGVPLDHLDWIGKAIVDYKPDVVVHIGDHWDFPSLNSHEEFGSLPQEGKRYQDDLRCGNEAFARICAPMEAERKKGKWKPELIFTLGNHEARADRVAENNPKLYGTVGSDQCDMRDWKRYEFLDVVNVDSILYSHFFQTSHSPRAIGGTVGNKLTKVGSSFVHGHVQGLDIGTKMLGNGMTLWGAACGSAYLHQEDYRGAQGQRHWRGVLILNEVQNGECCPMPLSLGYLCRKYTGMDLFSYMIKHYPHQCWLHLK